ncbi:MAG: hypothetical protein KDA21_09745, partial [Phycisphaerales bacterium]|nr:hypothetical protein [Phycisphaerales bacterium]
MIRQEPVVTGAVVDPVVVEGVDGVEVMWWVAEDADGRVGEVMRELEPAADFLSLEESRAWRENGLRMMRLPAQQLADLMGAIPPRGQLNRQWIGWSPRWREFFRGRQIGGATPLLVGGGRVSLAEGPARIIGRAWRGPGLSEEGTLAAQGTLF